MNDAIALLAISQLVCIGGMSYLYLQLQAMRRDLPRRRPAPRMEEQEAAHAAPSPVRARAAAGAYGAPQAQPQAQPRPSRSGQMFAKDAAGVASRLGELGVGVDVPTLARKMGKSEEEVRLLLRRRGIAS